MSEDAANRWQHSLIVCWIQADDPNHCGIGVKHNQKSARRAAVPRLKIVGQASTGYSYLDLLLFWKHWSTTQTKLDTSMALNPQRTVLFWCYCLRRQTSTIGQVYFIS